MEKIVKYELFKVLQKDRVDLLGTVVPQWMQELNSDEILIVSIPPIITQFLKTEPLVLNSKTVNVFMVWLAENSESIRGPHYNLPALNGFFTCIIAKEDYDPAIDGIPGGLGAEIRDTLTTFDTLLRSRQAA